MSFMIEIPEMIYILRYTGLEWLNHMGFIKGECGRWAEGLGIPKGGDTILYPGCFEMEVAYMPIYIKNTREAWEKWGNLRERFLEELRKRLDEAYPKLDVKRFNLFAKPLRAVAKLLKAVNYKFGFLYEDDLLTCAHYDRMGLDDLTGYYIQKKYRILREYGVKKVITTSPMSAAAMLKVYPRYVDNFDLDVKFYLDIIVDRVDLLPKKNLPKEPIVVHDCHNWGRTLRELNVPDKLRSLLEYVGGISVEPKYNRENVHCCGAPSGMVDPATVALIGKSRLYELLEPMKSTGAKKIVMACPNCFNTLYNALVNYGPKDVEMYDIAYYAANRLFGGVD